MNKYDPIPESLAKAIVEQEKHCICVDPSREPENLCDHCQEMVIKYKDKTVSIAK